MDFAHLANIRSEPLSIKFLSSALLHFEPNYLLYLHQGQCIHPGGGGSRTLIQWFGSQTSSLYKLRRRTFSSLILLSCVAADISAKPIISGNKKHHLFLPWLLCLSCRSGDPQHLPKLCSLPVHFARQQQLSGWTIAQFKQAVAEGHHYQNCFCSILQIGRAHV